MQCQPAWWRVWRKQLPSFLKGSLRATPNYADLITWCFLSKDLLNKSVVYWSSMGTVAYTYTHNENRICCNSAWRSTDSAIISPALASAHTFTQSHLKHQQRAKGTAFTLYHNVHPKCHRNKSLDWKLNYVHIAVNGFQSVWKVHTKLTQLMCYHDQSSLPPLSNHAHV